MRWSTGSVVVRDGRIAEIAPRPQRTPPARSTSRAITCCPAWSSCTPTIWRSISRRAPACSGRRAGRHGPRRPDRRRRHHDGVRFAVAGRRPRRQRPGAEPRPHGRGDLRRQRPPPVARRAPAPPALRGDAGRRRRGGRPLDRPAAGRPDLDQRPHARPAPVPRSGEAEAVLHGQVRHDRGAVRGVPRPGPRAACAQRGAPPPRDRLPRPGARPAAGQPRRRHARPRRGGGARTA